MEEQHLLTAKRFEVKSVKRTLADGTVLEREVVRHPGSVVILPIVDEDHICLIRNYRFAIDQTLFELPAGTMDREEPPESCAERELIEETGFRAGEINSLGGFYAAPGILDEYMYLFVAEDLTAGDPAREVGEEIENVIVPWAEAFEAIKTGKIQDAKTIVGLLRYKLHLELS